MVGRGREKIKGVLLILLYLAGIDWAVNAIWGQESRNFIQEPPLLQRYFEYGRSAEGKLERMTGLQEQDSAPIISHAWLQNECRKSTKGEEGGKKTIVGVYGMSHTKLLGEALGRLRSDFVIRDVTGPGAPPNWSMAAYLTDRECQKAEVVILGIMTDSVPFVTATTGATAYFDMAYPYTFPRFRKNGQDIEAVYPPFLSKSGYREYFFDRNKWTTYRQWLEQNDKYYNGFLFRKSILDRSVILRLVRRAFAESYKGKMTERIYTPNGFLVNSEEVLLTQDIVRTFAKMARGDGSLPIIYAVSNQNRKDHLFSMLKPALDADHIPYLSTHIICPPDDPKIFLPVNTHFIPEKDVELAQEIIKIIEREKKKIRTVS